MRIMRRLMLFLMCLCAALFAQELVREQSVTKSADITVLLDTSGTILPYRSVVSGSVLKDIATRFVRLGDSFHIISFSATPRHEISQVIRSEFDLSQVVSRFMILHQLGLYSDFLTALDFARTHLRALPAAHEKILIVVSDGIFNPPARSAYKNYNKDQVKINLARAAADLRREQVRVFYIKLPFPQDIQIRDLDDNLLTDLQKTDDVQISAVGSFAEGQTRRPKLDTVGVVSDQTGGVADNHAVATHGREDGIVQGVVGSHVEVARTQDRRSNADPAKREGVRPSSEATDVSREFTEDLGIRVSPVDSDGSVRFSEKERTLPVLHFPRVLEVQGKYAECMFEVENSTDAPVLLHLERVIFDNGVETDIVSVQTESCAVASGARAMLRTTFLLPKRYHEEGTYQVTMRVQFADNVRVFPQVATAELRVSPLPFLGLVRRGIHGVLSSVGLTHAFGYVLDMVGLSRTGFGAVLLPLFALAIFLVLVSAVVCRSKRVLSRKSWRGSPRTENGCQGPGSMSDFRAHSVKEQRQDQERVYAGMERIVSQRKSDVQDRLSVLNAATAFGRDRVSFSPRVTRAEHGCSRSGMTEIFVFDQTRAIGKRNIHVMKAGTRLGVGGHKGDDFLIFLVPFPRRLAQVYFDGEVYHLAILKPRYFPYEESSVVHDCVGRVVTLVSDRGYHVPFTFRQYEDPAVRLNNLLTSIEYA